MPDPVDAVAQAIWRENREHWQTPVLWAWDEITEQAREKYRRQAWAAIDTHTAALGLTEEWRTVGWVSTSTKEVAWRQHEFNGGEVQTRLVSPWERAEKNDA